MMAKLLVTIGNNDNEDNRNRNSQYGFFLSQIIYQ